MVIAVSGTPGTGKTVFSRLLAKKLDAILIDLKTLVEKKKVYTVDEDGTKAVDVLAMRREFSRELRSSRRPVVVEGLLSHLLQKKFFTHVVVLRTNPQILAQRLRARKYSEKKILENADAEALDIVLWEAVEAHGVNKVYEIDTTGIEAAKAVEVFMLVLKGKTLSSPGKFDWLEEHFKFD